MRAERLLSLVLMLRNRGRMTAPAIARELEVSVRTVLRDVEALSSVGIPVYAERGRDGGFALLPGFTTDLTGLTVDEATALLASSTSADTAVLGMAPAFAAAMRKVTDALPEAGRTAAIRASERILVTGSGWITEHRSIRTSARCSRLCSTAYAYESGIAHATGTPRGGPSTRSVSSVLPDGGIWWLCTAATNARTGYRVSTR